MQARDESDGAFVLHHDSTAWTWWLCGVAGLFAFAGIWGLFVPYDDRYKVVALFGSAATLIGIAFVFFERSDARFDPKTRRVTWSRRWAWSLREGDAPFDQIEQVLVETPIGDTGIPSRRICLRMRDGAQVPLTAGFGADHDDRQLAHAQRIRTLIGIEPPTPMESVKLLGTLGRTAEAVRELVRLEGLSLTQAMERIEQWRTKPSSP